MTKIQTRRRLTDKVLRGIRAACNAGLAGPVGDGGDFTEQDGDDMEAALAWANGQDVRDEELGTLRADHAIVRAELELAERDRRAAEYVRNGLSAYISSISGALMDSGMPVYEDDYARSIRELTAKMNRMQPVVEAAVAWENRREREPYAPLTQAVFDYLSPDSKEGA